MESLWSTSLLGKKVEPKQWKETWERWMTDDFVPSNRKVMELMSDAYRDGLSQGRNTMRADIIEFLFDMVPHAPSEHLGVIEGIITALEELYGKEDEPAEE